MIGIMGLKRLDLGIDGSVDCKILMGVSKFEGPRILCF